MTLIRIQPVVHDFLAAGHDPLLETAISVDLPALAVEDRELIARNVRMGGRCGDELVAHPGESHNTLAVTAPTVDALLTALRAAEQDAAGRRAEEEQAEAQRVARIRAAAAEVLRERRTRPATSPAEGLVPDWRHDTPEDVRTCPEALAWQRELDAENARRAEQKRQERAEREERHQREREAAEAELRAWALDPAGGSQRVKMLLEEERKAWLPIAEAEFLGHATPAGYAPLIGIARERTKPQVDDIQALREARELCQAHHALSDPAMAWIVNYRRATQDDLEDPDVDIDEDGDVVDEKFAAVTLVVSTPTGKRREIYTRVSA